MTDPSDASSSAEGAEQDKGQPLVEHLIELRTRILHALFAVMIVFLPLFYFANDIYSYVSEPLRMFLPEGTTMIATEVASPFLTPFKLTLVLSIFVAMPYILHQIWSFIAPGLYSSEKQIASPLLVSSIILFYTGIAFAFYVVFPLIFGFFTAAAPDGVTVMTDINRYLDFVLKLFFAFGLAFEIPIATVLLIWTGATTTTAMASKRAYVIVGCFVMGMLLTPPDIISQILLALPMWLLFEVGIIFARVFKLDQPDADATDGANSEAANSKER
jgi:sec-independent protein translocase protein TatC